MNAKRNNKFKSNNSSHYQEKTLFKKFSNSSDSTNRQLRVANLVRSAIVECMSKAVGNLDLRLISSVAPLTITEVKLTADLKIAKCYFIPFGKDLSCDEILDALNNSRSSIRAYVANQLKLKYSPEIRFFYDEHYNIILNNS